jgi:hypothetical protein
MWLANSSANSLLNDTKTSSSNHRHRRQRRRRRRLSTTATTTAQGEEGSAGGGDGDVGGVTWPASLAMPPGFPKVKERCNNHLTVFGVTFDEQNVQSNRIESCCSMLL